MARLTTISLRRSHDPPSWRTEHFSKQAHQETTSKQWQKN
jgi:hypothetical protein